MTAEGHLLFSIASAVFAKNAELTPVLAHGDWWHIIPSAILTCLLPDIDHPKSFLGQRLKWVSKPIARAFGHRGFTHSLLAVFALLATFYLKVPDTWIIPADALQGMVLGYLSHIVADMLTPAGVPLTVAVPLAFPPAYSGAAQRQSTGAIFYVWRCLPGRCGCRSPFRKIAPYAGLRR